ncbi:polyisoprenoid-binding protein YceI [Mucilaginibacter yixingensis]|uniref:Polyisoprenoid-binding protein YceI n=1 Tax=Mucilaginibacter yixingensis TaxID=1295612 RepID=A0A2T5JEH9_9SPHI|nr:YceI family protein [Mucilaginibacter yixingensis]PTR00850.1 polyisoprenoid-binding protein YceI [Mucilaginibacter yixingensis]
MKTTIIALLITCIGFRASAQNYKPAVGSTVQFKVTNLGFGVNGSFTGVEGVIIFDPSAPAKSNFDTSIDAATVNTDNNLRDAHLKEDGYFSVKTYPRIKLVSSSITGNGKNTYVFMGTLTMKGKSQKISFPFTALASGDGWLFKGSFKINRKDFDIGGTSTISNEVEITLNIPVTKA